MKQTVGYIRISHKKGEQDGISLERQESQIKAYCEMKGIKGLQILRDAGISGFKTTARPGFQKLVELCKGGQVERVIVFDLSRLSRSVRDTLEFIDDAIKKNDIAFVSLQQDINTETPIGKAFLVIASVFNQLYRDEISHKMKLAWQHKRKQGKKGPGFVPYGFRSEGGHLIAEENEQRTVGFIKFLRLKQRLTLTEISDRLGTMRVPTRRNGKWHPQTVKDILEYHSTPKKMAA